jgi:hypothetical protein
MKAYAGIGSRSTPGTILELIRTTAYHLAAHGWTLRSGCAQGADSAFEDGAFEAYFANARRPKPELYLPWPRFEGRRRTVVAREEPQAEAFPIAAQFHPAWDRLSQGARRLHARNVHQVLGRDVTDPQPSRFVLCWTQAASGQGGTGQAIRIAKHYGVEVIDLGDPSNVVRVSKWLSS